LDFQDAAFGFINHATHISLDKFALEAHRGFKNSIPTLQTLNLTVNQKAKS
jgi:hypothetical protein